MWSRHLKSRSMIALRDFQDGRRRKLVAGHCANGELEPHVIGSYQVVPVWSVSVRTPTGHSQRGKPYEGRRTAQGEAWQRNTRILSGAHPPDACGRSRASRNRDRDRGIHRSKTRRNTGNALGELRGRSDADYAIRIWQPCGRTQEREEQSASARHSALGEVPRPPPGGIGESRDWLDLQVADRNVIGPGATGSVCHSARAEGRRDWSGTVGTHFVAGWQRTSIGSAYRIRRSRRFSDTRISPPP